MSDIPTQLLITDIGYILAIIVFWASGIFVLSKNPRKSTNQLFFLLSITTTNFFIAHILGINTSDPELSRFILMFNIGNIFAVMATMHWILSLIGKSRERALILAGMDGAGLGLFIFYILFPATYLLPSQPIMYFTNYYVRGPLYSGMVIYFLIVMIYSLWEIYHAYKIANASDKNRLKYILIGVGFAFFASMIPLLPMYNIYIDPIISAFIWIYIIPLAYSAISYDLMDIKIVARKSAWYVIIVAILTLIIVAVTSFSIFIGQSIPSFPILAIPLIASIMVVVVGHFVWKRTKDEEVLKSEFITIVTHKFRTPLTSIKWSTENIISATTQDEIRKHAEYIAKANNELVELTNVLMESSNAESADMNYRMKPIALGLIMEQVIINAKSMLGGKGVKINTNITDNLPLINADEEKIRFVIQVMIDNAIAYTPSGKNVTATILTEKDDIICRVNDEGMGISKNDIPHIFTKFYRSEKATGTDTEGVGLGLYMAKTIIEKHGGKIWITSPGEGLGTEVGFRVRKV